MTDVHDMTIEQILADVEAMRPRATRIRLFYQEGEQTLDRRVIDIGATNFDRPPPWALRIQRVAPAEGGHANAELAGVLDAFYRDGPTLVLEGRIDLASEAGSELERLAYEGFLQTWSPDLADAVIDVEEHVNDEDSDLADPAEQVAHFVSATFNGATVVAMPALASAVFELLDDEGRVLARSPKREVDTAAPTRTHVIERVVAAPVTDLSISACAGPTAPPPEFFTDPEFTELTRYVYISPEGRFTTHVASYDECHIGYLDRCITIREIADCRGEGNFEHAIQGYVICSDGSRVSTGPVTIKGGHAPKGLSAAQAMAHYDDPDSAFADVVYGMDEFGCWASGRVRPTATEYQIDIARASGVSLDARQIGGKLRYLATCAVNTRGFTKASARLAASASGDLEILELVAAGGRPLPAPDDCGCGKFDAVIDPGATANSISNTLTRLAIKSLEDDLP